MIAARNCGAAARLIEEASEFVQGRTVSGYPRAIKQMVQNPLPEDCIVLSGQGDILARRVLEHMHWNPRIVSLEDTLGADLSRVAPAHAVAM